MSDRDDNAWETAVHLVTETRNTWNFEEAVSHIYAKLLYHSYIEEPKCTCAKEENEIVYFNPFPWIPDGKTYKQDKECPVHGHKSPID